MMTTATREAHRLGTGADDTVHHFVACHDEDIAMCGADLSDVPWTDETIDCVVCVELDGAEPDVCTCLCCQ